MVSLGTEKKLNEYFELVEESSPDHVRSVRLLISPNSNSCVFRGQLQRKHETQETRTYGPSGCHTGHISESKRQRQSQRGYTHPVPLHDVERLKKMPLSGLIYARALAKREQATCLEDVPCAILSEHQQ